MERTQRRRLDGPRRAWLVFALLLPWVFVPGLASAQVGEGSDTCSLSYNWLEGFIWIDSPSSDSYEQLACEPIPLIVDAMHFVMIDEICIGCGDRSNKHVELMTNLEYSWTILTPDGGKLATIANDDSRAGITAEGKAVMYHSPPLEDGESRTIHVEVTAINGDGDKPVHASITGVFTIELTGDEVTDTQAEGNWELERTRNWTLADVSFAGDFIEGPGGSEIIFGCDPDVQWEDSSPISGDFWVAGSGNPVTTLVTGEVAVLSALGVDVDDMVLQCNATVPDCTSGEEITTQLSDVLEYEWSVSAGSLAFGVNQGSEVIYFAPEDPSVTQVTISVSIKDTEMQYIDAPLSVQKTFPVMPDEVRAAALQIRTNDTVIYPTPSTLPPYVPNGTTMRMRYYRTDAPPVPRRGDGSIPAPPPIQPPGVSGPWLIRREDDRWEMEKPTGEIILKHPYEAGVGLLNGARHPAPPSGFGAFDSYRSWTDSQKEYWVTVGADVVAARRHDLIRRFDDFDFLGNVGKLKIRSAPGYETGYPETVGFTSQTYVYVSGECTETARIQVLCLFSADRDLNGRLRGAANRVDSGQSSSIMLSVRADPQYPEVRPTYDFGRFPRIRKYLGTDGGTIQLHGQQEPAPSAVQFIDDLTPTH